MSHSSDSLYNRSTLYSSSIMQLCSCNVHVFTEMFMKSSAKKNIGRGVAAYFENEERKESDVSLVGSLCDIHALVVSLTPILSNK